MDENFFKNQVIKIIKIIPSGKVTTYGTVAILAGFPKSAREVGYILHSSAQKYDLPWQRVVNKKGYISNRGGDMNIKNLQKSLLEQEGVRVSEEFVIDLEKYGWWGNSLLGVLSIRSPIRCPRSKPSLRAVDGAPRVSPPLTN